jgi:hypothetical protein
MTYKGVIIEESLENKDVLKDVAILSTKVEEVTEEHHTPHLKQWTLHTVEIPEDRGEEAAEKLSKVLEISHGHWYADFKNEKFHYIIFRNKVFKVDRSKPEEYKKVTEYGLSLGIPDYQLDFSPEIEEWKRD